MGCHTWFWRKIEVDKKDVKKAVVEYFESEIRFAKLLVSDRNSIDQELLDAYPEWTIEHGHKCKAVFTRKLRMIQKDLCQLAMMHKYHNAVSEHVTYNEAVDSFYETNDELPHDLFRTYGYPKNELRSYEETVFFIKNNECETYEYTFDSLIKFWNENPDGMITLG